jgi:hypothetical protein
LTIRQKTKDKIKKKMPTESRQENTDVGIEIIPIARKRKEKKMVTEINAIKPLGKGNQVEYTDDFISV